MQAEKIKSIRCKRYKTESEKDAKPLPEASWL